MRKAFTITELLVAIGLLAAVLAVSAIIFNYSIEAQRAASATAEIMRTLRAITDQLNINFAGLQKDGYLILRSEENNPPGDTNNIDALYFFSISEGNFFQSWENSDIWSNMARIFLGHSKTTIDSNHLPGNLTLDMLLLTPGHPSGLDYNDANFAECQHSIISCLGEDPNQVLSSNRPDVNMAHDPNDARRLLAKNVGSFKIEWTYGWFRPTDPDKIVWWGLNQPLSAESSLVKPGGIPVLPAEISSITAAIQENKNAGPPPYYTVQWNPSNQQYWPKALRFTFMLYDSKGIIKNGRRFEHIVYIGQ